MPREQFLEALAKANVVRLRRAEIKHAVHDGEMSLLDAMADPATVNMPLSELLAAQRNWGLTTAVRLLSLLEMPSTLRVGDLSGKRRVVLFNAAARTSGKKLGARYVPEFVGRAA